MPGESLSFDITAHDNASRKFRDVGDAALSASAKMDVAAASAKLWSDTAIKQGKAADTSVAAMKSHSAATALAADAERVLAGEATKTTKLIADQGRTFDDTGKKTVTLGSRFSAMAGSGGIAGGGMGAAIAAGVVLSPVIATVGVGLAGLGAAAYGIISPIEKAAGKTGGLRAHLDELNAEQKTVAQGILGLGKQFGVFQEALKPEVLGLFNSGIRIAGHLLQDVRPVAAATGKALNQVLASVDAEFQSGTWQQFFAWMAATAGPDVKLLGQSFTDLLQVLPPLIEDLQPLATGLLTVTDDAVKAAGAVTSFYDAFQRDVPISNVHTANFLKDLDRWTVDLTNHIPGAQKVNDWITGLQQSLTGTAAAAKPAAAGVQHLGQTTADLIHPLGAANHGLAAAGVTAKHSTMNLQAMTAQVTALDNAESKSLDTQLAYSNALITGANDAQALRRALRASHGEVGLHTAAERASFGAANTYIADLENTAKQAVASGKGASGAAQAIKNGLPILEQAARHNHALWQEVQTLKNWLDKLRSEGPIAEKINVLGMGQWSVTAAKHALAQGPGPFAAGGRITAGTTSTADDVLIRASKNETVLSAAHSALLAPLLARIGVPGYAAGGIAGSYRDGAAGLAPWSRRDLNATTRLIEAAVARATFAGMKAAAARFAAGPGGPAGRGTHASMPYLEGLWDAAGGPPGLAHLMAAIAMAESGGNANAFNASGATGLWQILGAVDPRDQPFLFNPQVNAHEAVLKYRSQGLGAWVTYTNGAYKAYYAAGGRVPGYGGGDRWPALLEGGEAVIPKHLTPVLAPFLKAHGVPGFAQGGLAGALAGLTTGSSHLWDDIHRFLKAIADHFTGQERKRLDRVVERQAGDMAAARASLRRVESRMSAASAYAGSVTQGLSGFAALSGLSVGGGFVGKPGGGERRLTGGQMIAYQLQGKLAALRKWSGLLRRLSGMGAPASILRQIVDMGPDDGVPYAQELIAGGPKLMRQLSGLEGQIGAQEQRIGRGAATAVYTGHYITGQAVGRAFDSQEAHLRRLFARLGNELGREAAKWLHGGRARKFDSGGWLHPGATLAVNTTGVPERVLPPGASGQGGPLVRIDQMVVQDATDVHLVAQRLSFSITAAGLGS